MGRTKQKVRTKLDNQLSEIPKKREEIKQLEARAKEINEKFESTYRELMRRNIKLADEIKKKQEELALLRRDIGMAKEDLEAANDDVDNIRGKIAAFRDTLEEF